MNPDKNSGGSSPLLIVAIIFIILILCTIGGVKYYKYKQGQEKRKEMEDSGDGKIIFDSDFDIAQTHP